MGKLIKFLCLNFILVVFSLTLGAEEVFHFKGEYFLYSADLNYIYGGGRITLTVGTLQITADSLYLDISQLTGILYGDITITETKIETVPAAPGLNLKETGTGKEKGIENSKENEIEEKEKNTNIDIDNNSDSDKNKVSRENPVIKKADAVFFKGLPPKYLAVQFDDVITVEGDKELLPLFVDFIKKAPGELKKSSVFFEFKEFTLDQKQKIKARMVIPYTIGLPTFPLKKLTVKRGQWADKTMIALNKLNYSEVDGLSVSFLLRLKEKFIDGDLDIKLYERQLFKLGQPNRGVLVSGQNRILIKDKELLHYSTLFNTGEKSFNFKIVHQKNFKHLSYSLSQDISGRESRPTFFEFASEVTLTPIKAIAPAVKFTHNLKNSRFIRVSTPLNIVKKLGLNLGWQRKIIDEGYRSDVSDIDASLNFDASFFSMNSNCNFSKNLIEASVRKNFSVNLRFKPVRLLSDNISMDISTFYMFSSLPLGLQNISKITPGFNVAFRSEGAWLPFRFKFVPTIILNHLWDNREENFTDFQYALGLRKEIGKFAASIEYALASRYRAKNFWIEGSGQQNVNLNLELKDELKYAFLLRFYCNDSLALENISLTGQVNLPYELKFSSFLLFYYRENRFQTVEVFIEKSFRSKLKIQGGYSLALKRFFLKFLTL